MKRTIWFVVLKVTEIFLAVIFICVIPALGGFLCMSMGLVPEAGDSVALVYLADFLMGLLGMIIIFCVGYLFYHWIKYNLRLSKDLSE